MRDLSLVGAGYLLSTNGVVSYMDKTFEASLGVRFDTRSNLYRLDFVHISQSQNKFQLDLTYDLDLKLDNKNRKLIFRQGVF